MRRESFYFEQNQASKDSAIFSVTNQGGQVLFSAGQFGYVQSVTTPPTNVPPGQGVARNTPSFQSGPSSDSNAECVVQ